MEYYCQLQIGGVNYFPKWQTLNQYTSTAAYNFLKFNSQVITKQVTIRSLNLTI